MLSNDLQIVLNAFQLVEHRVPIGRSLLIEQSERTKREHYNGCNGKKKERASSKRRSLFRQVGPVVGLTLAILERRQSKPPMRQALAKPMKVRLRALSEKVECT